MEQVICEGPETVVFWDRYAPWYKLWMEHTAYHENVIDVLTTMVQPGWTILDIGAGNGVLSLPLCSIGCDVTAIEPSHGMRNLLREQALFRGIDWITVDERRWEDTLYGSFQQYDLIMACNSLHLMDGGFIHALDSIFQTRAKKIFIITEHTPGTLLLTKLLTKHPGYSLLFSKSCEADDSFRYHYPAEALEHQSFRMGSHCASVEHALKKSLCHRDGHFVLPSRATVNMYWWQRDNDSLAQ
ncbi:MAG: methyltransferase domain-containing protein [Nitrospirota bacterium]